ncbi:MAG: hypothetical protein AB1546_09455 [bacterium]
MSFHKIISYFKSFVAPAAVTVLTLLYFQFLHMYLYFGNAQFAYWLPVLLIPPVALEIYFTSIFEVRAYGWRKAVIYGLITRLLFISALFYFYIWETLRVKNTPNVYLPLLSKFPFNFRYFWIANPKISIVIILILLIIYLFFTCRLKVFRFITTVLLPIAASLLLFQLFYHPPEFVQRIQRDKRPDFVEKVFPTDEYKISQNVLENLKYPRDIYVSPNDEFVFAGYGSTYGFDIWNKPNVLWIDLVEKKSWHKKMDAIRRFYTECPRKIYFAPWHGSELYSFDTDKREFRKFKLPAEVAGYPVEEINFTYYACDTQTVYMVNSRNPVIFAWDAERNKLKKTAALAGQKGMMFGDTLAMIARNHHSNSLYMIVLGRYQMIDVDEKTLKVKRFIKLPDGCFDILVSSDGKYIYVPGAYKGAIWQLDTKSMKVRKKFPAPIHCRRLLLSRDEKYLFASSYVTGYFVVYDINTGRKLLNIYVTPKIDGMYMTNNFLYLLGAEGLFRIKNEDILKHIKMKES